HRVGPPAPARGRRRHRAPGDARSRPCRWARHARRAGARRPPVVGRTRVHRSARALSRADRSGVMFFRTAWLVVRKDVAIEARSWEVVTTTLFFATATVLIFAFAFVKE